MSLNPSQKRLKQLAQRLPSRDEVIDTLAELQSKDEHTADRAVAIVGATLIEHGLKVIILSSLVKLTDKETDKLFDGDDKGPLATFSDRIKMAYALGLIGRKSRRDLDRVRYVRNIFAHSALKVDFGFDEITAMCDQFELIEKDDTRTAKAAYIETVASISGAFQKTISHEITVMMHGGAITMPRQERRFLP